MSFWATEESEESWYSTWDLSQRNKTLHGVHTERTERVQHDI